MFSEDSILLDDGIYMMIQICIHQFSYNIDIQVGRVFLETCAPSGYCLKDQQKKAGVNKLPYMQALKEITALIHKQELSPQWTEH